MTDRNSFHIGTDDMFSRIVTREGSAYSLSGITKVAVCFNGTVYDSDNYAASFDWTTGETGEIKFYLGKITDIDTPASDTKAELLLYDSVSTNGFVVDELHIKALEIE